MRSMKSGKVKKKKKKGKKIEQKIQNGKILSPERRSEEKIVNRGAERLIKIYLSVD